MKFIIFHVCKCTQYSGIKLDVLSYDKIHYTTIHTFCYLWPFCLIKTEGINVVCMFLSLRTETGRKKTYSRGYHDATMFPWLMAFSLKMAVIYPTFFFFQVSYTHHKTNRKCNGRHRLLLMVPKIRFSHAVGGQEAHIVPEML